MSAILELFGHSTDKPNDAWQAIVNEQRCPFINGKCFKVRKSDPQRSIGTCSVRYGKAERPILICPARLKERQQIFTDCLHLLTTHEPGNELHIVSEVPVPGGNIDHFVVSSKRGKVKDFVGVELQTIDTTGTVWPDRQRLLRRFGVPREDDAENHKKRFGMNWKMTAKTTLVQMHHKIQTFEHVSKKLVLVVQDVLLEYMRREFDFRPLQGPATLGDSMHLHVYRIDRHEDGTHRLGLDSRLGTDSEGVGICLGLQAQARLGLERIISDLEARISADTLFVPMANH